MQGEALAENLSQYQLTGLLLLSELAGWCPDILFPHGLEASPEAALLEGTRLGSLHHHKHLPEPTIAACSPPFQCSPGLVGSSRDEELRPVGALRAEKGSLVEISLASRDQWYPWMTLWAAGEKTGYITCPSYHNGFWDLARAHCFRGLISSLF